MPHLHGRLLVIPPSPPLYTTAFGLGAVRGVDGEGAVCAVFRWPGKRGYQLKCGCLYCKACLRGNYDVCESLALPPLSFVRLPRTTV